MSRVLATAVALLRCGHPRRAMNPCAVTPPKSTFAPASPIRFWNVQAVVKSMYASISASGSPSASIFLRWCSSANRSVLMAVRLFHGRSQAGSQGKAMPPITGGGEAFRGAVAPLSGLGGQAVQLSNALPGG